MMPRVPTSIFSFSPCASIYLIVKYLPVYYKSLPVSIISTSSCPFASSTVNNWACVPNDCSLILDARSVADTSSNTASCDSERGVSVTKNMPVLSCEVHIIAARNERCDRRNTESSFIFKVMLNLIPLPEQWNADFSLLSMLSIFY